MKLMGLFSTVGTLFQAQKGHKNFFMGYSHHICDNLKLFLGSPTKGAPWPSTFYTVFIGNSGGASHHKVGGGLVERGGIFLYHAHFF